MLGGASEPVKAGQNKVRTPAGYTVEGTGAGGVLVGISDAVGARRAVRWRERM